MSKTEEVVVLVNCFIPGDVENAVCLRGFEEKDMVNEGEEVRRAARDGGRLQKKREKKKG